MKAEIKITLAACILLIGGLAGFRIRSEKIKTNSMENDHNTFENEKLEKATFGTGCFWCTEAVFEAVEGVKSVVSGYEGGLTAHPTYKEVCTGTTGHAECVEITYDPTQTSYLDLLQIFFRVHDPTSLNRQGADEGTQYRSVIFYHSASQKEQAEKAVSELDKSGAYDKKIVTEITKAQTFYRAEDYHQNYFAKNPNQGYCAAVVAPKVAKFKSVFKDRLKKEFQN